MTDWDERFIDLAAHISQWSKDPSTKVGAVIVDHERRIVSTGYNGFPMGMPAQPWMYMDRLYKLERVVHAEANAILFADREKLINSTIYTYPLPPCADCAKLIVQSGIGRVVVPNVDIQERWSDSCGVARHIFKEAEIEYVRAV